MQHLDEGTIHAWLDGALPADEAEVVEMHVRACAACAAAVADARGLIAASSRILQYLDDVPGNVVPHSDRDEIASRGVSGGENDLSVATRRRARVWWRTPGVRAAAAVLVMAAGITVVMRKREEPRRSATVAMSPAASTVVPSATSTATSTTSTNASAGVSAPAPKASAPPAPQRVEALRARSASRETADAMTSGGSAATPSAPAPTSSPLPSPTPSLMAEGAPPVSIIQRPHPTAAFMERATLDGAQRKGMVRDRSLQPIDSLHLVRRQQCGNAEVVLYNVRPTVFVTLITGDSSAVETPECARMALVPIHSPSDTMRQQDTRVTHERSPLQRSPLQVLRWVDSVTGRVSVLRGWLPLVDLERVRELVGR